MSPQDTSLGDRELDVMAVLWETGSGTVQEVKDQLRDMKEKTRGLIQKLQINER